jgi:sulfoxide reductase catalytic subunit YedY
MVRSVYGKTRRIIIPKGTKRSSLINKNPNSLDTRNLEITPLKDFETMGITDHEVDLDKWRLEVSGHVERPVRLNYAELITLPSLEKNVLMICPGVFVNHGHWKGISIGALLKMAKVKDGATHVTLQGPKGPYAKTQRFTLEDALSKKVFLAYQVNGERLPKKHGFPLRTVAEGYYRYDWVTHVYKVAVDKIGKAKMRETSPEVP